MKKQLEIAHDLQRVAEGRLRGKRALNVLAKAVAEVAGPSDFQWKELGVREDCAVNAARAKKWVARTVKDFDRGGYTNYELLLDLQRLRHDAERMRIEGPRFGQDMLDHHCQRQLWKVGIIETYVTRLMGIPCEAGQDALETHFGHPAMRIAIQPLAD